MSACQVFLYRNSYVRVPAIRVSQQLFLHVNCLCVATALCLCQMLVCRNSYFCMPAVRVSQQLLLHGIMNVLYKARAFQVGNNGVLHKSVNHQWRFKGDIHNGALSKEPGCHPQGRRSSRVLLNREQECHPQARSE
eukprot:3262074-Pyramimonas_sp.AAC.1